LRHSHADEGDYSHEADDHDHETGIKVRAVEFSGAEMIASIHPDRELGGVGYRIYRDTDLAAIDEALAKPEDLVVLGQRTAFGNSLWAGMARVGADGSVSAWNPCTAEWDDVTEIFSRAASVVDERDPVATLTALVNDQGDGQLIERFAIEWERGPDGPAWVEREASDRSYTDADLPVSVQEGLARARVELVYDGPLQEGSPFAVCPRQAEALVGYCIAMEAFAREKTIVFDFAIDPNQPVEIWIHDERTEPDGPHHGPIMTLDDASKPLQLSFETFLREPYEAKDVDDFASGLSARAVDVIDGRLEDPESRGFAVVGGTDPVYNDGTDQGAIAGDEDRP